MATKLTRKTRKPRKKAPTVAVVGPIPKLKIDMPLDARKIQAIQRCIEKGTLSITVSKVDLATGRLGDGWLYD
jgi:hypothetical protein